ncbi:MAG TPA: hypothetical protein D7H78_00210 [Candidatus Poseidoniales archaeon]|nr:MAG TPA: hypothetical protein D7H78_00210 [Candidatus Poseidoniales archaeon]
MKKHARCRLREKDSLVAVAYSIVMRTWCPSEHAIHPKFEQRVHSAKVAVAKSVDGLVLFEQIGGIFRPQKRDAPTHNQPIV